ncbi:MAG: hypothetical protein WBA59_02495 [Moheibacter sp.]
MKKENLISFVFFVLVIMGCAYFFNDKRNKPTEEGNRTKNANCEKLIQSIELDSDGNVLELFKSEIENTITLQTKKNGTAISRVGCGNSEYINNEKGSIKLDSLKFSEKDKGYLITSYIKGSTYGAECYFIVFKRTQWLIMTLPFNRAKFYDTNQDGFDEIIEYKSQSDSIIYTFKSGLVLPIESK